MEETWDSEIDLRKYVGLLLQNWFWILGITIGAAAAAFLFSSLQRPTYDASVYVGVTKRKIEVQFGTAIRTLTEEELIAAGARALVDREARLATFRQLVMNPAIAEELLPQFADRLREIDENLTNAARLLEHVETDESNKNDLVVITVSLPDPVLAADLANAWAQAYEKHVNRLYSTSQPEDVQDMQAQAEQARTAYMQAQTALEAYLADNPIPRLQREINLLQSQIDSYQSALREANTLTSEGDLAARRQLLSGYYSDRVTIERLLDDARSFQEQLALGEASPGAAFGDTLAMIFLRSRAFAGANNESGAPFSLQLQTPLTAEVVAPPDIENLIHVLENRKLETERKIAALTPDLLAPPQNSLPEDAGSEINERIATLTARVQSLQGQLEAETAHRKDLERQRDLHWDTYTTLAKKVVEQQVAAQGGSTEVRVASVAVPPARPSGSRKLVNTAIAGALGSVMSTGIVLFNAWWREGQPEESEETISQSG